MGDAVGAAGRRTSRRMQLMPIRKMTRGWPALAVALLLTCAVQGAELTIALKASLRTTDPHYFDLASNNAFLSHIYDSLVLRDKNQALQPGLAVFWRPVGKITWEFVLRRGVKFHDGSDFNADDVIYSLGRAASAPNSPASFARYTRRIVSMEKVDEITVRLRTERPWPLLPQDLSHVRIMSFTASEGKTTAQLDAGDGAVGTGPYRLLSREPDRQAVLARNPDYWGREPPWERVTFRFIPHWKDRLAALQTGRADVIDSVPPKALKQLRKARRKISLARGVSSRLIFLQLDSGRNKTPFVTGTRGKNPLQKLRVRKAISLAINRKAIADKIMLGRAVPAGQFFPKGHSGYTPGLEPDKPDLRKAKRLLARGGFGGGFGLTLHGPNDRFLSDAEVLHAVAKSLRRIGIRAEVETRSRRIFFPRAARREFSAYLSGWNVQGGEASAPLRALVASYDRERGTGRRNFGRFSNAELDAILGKALKAMDPGRRKRLLQEATRIAIGQYGIIPLHFEVDTWAMRKGLKLVPRSDGATLATGIFPTR